jgi:hypothetical protein
MPYVPSMCSFKRVGKANLEAHYNQVTRHFGVEKIVAILQNYFYWLKLQ